MIRIHKYRPDDRERLRQLVLELHQTLRPLDADLAPGEEIIDTYLEHLLATQLKTHGTILVATHDGQPVGYLCLFGKVDPETPDEINRPHAFLADLYVRRDFRRRGIGTRLLEKAEALSYRLGVHKIELGVLTGNQEAIRFYQRQGYAGRILVMAKHLRVSPGVPAPEGPKTRDSPR